MNIIKFIVSAIKLIIKLLAIVFILVIIFVLGIALLVIIAAPLLPFESDYCIEDGECELNRKLVLNNNKQITINKETCLENAWEWWDKGQICKINKNDITRILPIEKLN